MTAPSRARPATPGRALAGHLTVAPASTTVSGLTSLLGRTGRLLGSCLLVGLGVGLVLLARLGSDGYSTLVNGTVRASGLPYGLVNPFAGLTLIAFAAARGVRPGLGTVAHPLIVGQSVEYLLAHLTAPDDLAARLGLLGLGVAVLAMGIAGYLETQLGAGPVEAAALALRPLPFTLAYNALQATAALTGWHLGADAGVGTLIVVLAVGPLVQLLRGRRKSSFTGPSFPR